jgi:hypothetical protein
MPTVKDVIERRLKGVHGHIAVHIWQREDVKGIAREKGIQLSDKAADEILDSIDDHVDSELGITWETLRCEVDDWKDRHPHYRRCEPEEE